MDRIFTVDGSANFSSNAGGFSLSNRNFGKYTPDPKRTPLLNVGSTADLHLNVYAKVKPGAQAWMSTTANFLAFWENKNPTQILVNAGFNNRCQIVGPGIEAPPDSQGDGNSSANPTVQCVMDVGAQHPENSEYFLVDRLNFRSLVNIESTTKNNGQTAQEASVNSVISFSFKVVGNSMEKLEGDQTGVVNELLPTPLKVRVTNVDANGIASSPADVRVDFTVTDPNGQQSAGFGNTDATGVAQFQFALGASPGTYNIRAVCSSCMANDVVNFSVNAITREQATELRELLCTETGFTGRPLTNPLQVRAINTLTGKGVPQLNITFSVQSAPGSSSLDSAAVTDAKGVAKSNMTLGSAQGVYIINAHCDECLAKKDVTCAVAANPPPDLDDSGSTSPLPLIRRLRQAINRPAPGGDAGVQLTISPTEILPVDDNCNPLLPGHLKNATIQIFSSAPDAPCEISLFAVPLTGGHAHVSSSRPVGTINNQTCQTDSSGQAQFTYESGIAAGEIEVFATVSGAGSANAFLHVGLPNGYLQPLPDNPNLYQKAYRGAGTHPNNQFATVLLRNQINALAAVFTSSFSAAGKSAVMSINDLSLNEGGIFDLHGNWAQPHLCHRTGTSIDLNRSKFVQSVRRNEPIIDLANKIQLLLNQHPEIDCARVIEPKRDGKCAVHLECPASAAAMCPGGAITCTEN